MTSIKRRLDGYFFGGTPALPDALLFYGVLVLCTAILLVSGTVNVLNWEV